jgi:phage tail-like protein
MATHESWQFAFVRELDTDLTQISNIGIKSPLKCEASNLPVGSKPIEEQPTQVVSGNHIRVFWSVPSNPQGYTLTGKVKVFRKTKEFTRFLSNTQAVLVIDQDLSTTIELVERDYLFLHLDEQDLVLGNTYYYTIFWEVTHTETSITSWAFSPINSLDRAIVLDSSESVHGGKLYEYMPIGVRQEDVKNGDSYLYKLLSVLGKMFDEFKERLDTFEDKKYKIDEMDAHLIPYIDQMLGWPTNFELGELRRREETNNIVDIWKGKGANNSVELALQTLLNWDVEIVQSKDYILTTATGEERYYESSAPTGWDDSVDGNWQALREALPRNTMPDFSDRVILRNSLNDNYRVMNDFSEDAWKSIYKIVVELINPSSTGRPLLGNLVKQKIRRMLPYLLIHYADFGLLSRESYSDSGEIGATESTSYYPYRPTAESYELQATENSLATGLDILYTWQNSAPQNSANNVLWSLPLTSSINRTFHAAFTY